MSFADDYQLGRRLGAGGAGEVFLATRRRDNRAVAVKFSLGRDAGIPQERERFASEAKLIAQLESPYVVRVLGAGVHEGRLYYVMEYVEGATLGEHVREKGNLSPARSYRMAWALARALESAHKLGIVHRDVKPANVMVDAKGQPRLTDFGLAKGARSEVRTRTGIILGTPGYLAPEVLEGQPATPAADIYALGCMLYLCLTGRRLFNDSDLGDVMRAQLAGPDEEDLALLAPVERRVIERLVARKMQDRPSAGEVANRLKELAEDQSVGMARGLSGGLPAQEESATVALGSSGSVGQSTRLEGSAPVRSPPSPQPPPAREPQWATNTPASVVAPGRGLPKPLLLGGVGLALLALALLRGWTASPPEVPPAPPPSQASSTAVDETLRQAFQDLRTFRWTEFLRQALGGEVHPEVVAGLRDDLDRRNALTGRDEDTAYALRSRWRGESRGPLEDWCRTEPWFAAVRTVQDHATRAWWRGAEDEDGLRFRRRLAEALARLRRVNRLDTALGGLGNLVPGVDAALRPVLEERALASYPGPTWDVPDIAAGGFRRCVTLTPEPDHPTIQVNVAGYSMTMEQKYCPVNDGLVVDQVELDLPGDRDLEMVASFYDFSVGGLARAEFYAPDAGAGSRPWLTWDFYALDESMLRTTGISEDWNAMPIALRIAPALLGPGGARVRIRHHTLLEELDDGSRPRQIQWVTVAGAGWRPLEGGSPSARAP